MKPTSAEIKEEILQFRLKPFNSPRLFAEQARAHIELNAVRLRQQLSEERDSFNRFLLKVTHGTSEATYKRAKLIDDWCRRRRTCVTREQAGTLIGWLGSFDVARSLASLSACMEEKDWWIFFGEHWNDSDDAHAIWDFLFWRLALASGSNLRLAMSDAEAAEVDSLPQIVTVYRGCYEHNETGLSWSLSRDIAAAFPTYLRYSHPTESPILLTGEVDKRRIILKLDRDEQEVLSADIDVLCLDKL